MLGSPKNPMQGMSVTLNTWGTHNDGGNGMAHFFDSQFFGGNVGHASLAITIPANKEGLELIKKYCLKGDKTILPFERTSQNMLDDNNKVIKQDVFTVYFSWWPGNKTGFHLRPHLNSDNESERTGVDVGPIDEKFTNPNNPHALTSREQRTYQGVLGSRKMNLSSEEVAHITSLNEEQKKFLTLERELKEIDKKLDAIATLGKKIPDDKDNIKVEGSLLALLDKYILDWKNIVTNPKVLSKEDSVLMKEKIKQLKIELKEEKDIIQYKRDVAKEVMMLPETQLLSDEITTITTSLENLPLLERLEKAKLRDDKFSQKAYIQYEQKIVSEEISAVQNFSTFLQITNFSTQKEKILDALFDKKYPEKMLNTKGFEDWRQFLPAEFKNVTRDTMTPEIYKEVQKNAKEFKQSLITRLESLIVENKLYDKSSPFFHGDYGHFVTRGHAPDNQIQLPISGLLDGEKHQGGLNVERMLQKMRALTEDNEKFDLTTKNCSVTTGGILAAGAEPELKSYFEKKAWGGFGNPQEVYNGALQYQHTVFRKQGQKSIGEKLSSINPLRAVSWVTGKMLTALVSPSTSVPTKIAAGIGVGIMSPIAAGVEILKGIVNPKKTVNNCAKFMNYAWKNNSIFLKICSIPVGIMAAVMAIPAALQYGVQKAIIEPISNAINRQSSPVLQEQPLLGPQIEHNKRITDKIVNINELDPVKAIAMLATKCQENPNTIPVLSKAAQTNVDQYLNALDKTKPADLAKIMQYEDLAKQILNRTNQIQMPPQKFEQPVIKNEVEESPRKSLLSSYEHFHELNKPESPIKPVPDSPPDNSPRSSRRLN